MSEMKSALEKALERAERLGRLSPDEVKERRRAEYTPIGRAVADRYLGHGHGGIFIEELNAYGGEEKDIVIGAALSRLGEAIELGNYEVTERAIEGILALKGRDEVGGIGEEIRSLLKEYKLAENERYKGRKEEIERKGRELLHQLRISGSAVAGINLEASETWKEMAQELYARFDQRLQELKEKLLNP
jgi:hypothetical protein